MTRIIALTIIAPLALAPVVASAQQQGAGGAVSSSRGGDTSPDRGDDGPVRLVVESNVGITRNHGAINNSICPPGGSLHWEIVAPPEPGQAWHPSGYLLSCS
ncbi:hypothetical protein KUL25_20900 [Rhodobacteraceae bacterium N5(2021)]|uniref:Uncharacterized protein n=1 Tax=Gymnodinialimonas phycosphaerae TaxID=2841589 RepID=A0A975TV88_9RHOB|nr:hypothetical protein [Gymnodinialimonas phycosphaerae]MBY4895229.1 hypothetical protein [Gymnodinialimonas phycosphaerae]